MKDSAPPRAIFCSSVKYLSVLVLLCAMTNANNIFQPQALDFSGIYKLKQIDPNLTGEGLSIGVISRSTTYLDSFPQNDYRPDIEHRCFNQNKFSFYDDDKLQAGHSEHTTAICSILFGQDPNAGSEGLGKFNYSGALSESKAEIFEFWHFLKTYVFTNTKPDTDLLTVSAGSPFEDWWTRGLEAMAQQHDLVIVAGIGNGLSAYDPPLYPAAGSNIIAVGLATPIFTNNDSAAFDGFSFAQPDISTCGPTDDMRCKPDIIAPGDCLVAALGEPNSYRASGSFSSFATPVVAGAAGLLLQKAVQDARLADAAKPEVIKAILMNSATKMPYWHKGKVEKKDDHIVPLDWIQGAGMINAVGAYQTLTAGQFKNGDVSQTGWDFSRLDDANSANSYILKIDESNNTMITITAVWNRHYQNQYPFEALPEKDADIKLELWAIDSQNPQYNYLLDYSDSKVDNVEHIYIKADPNYIEYEIIVSYPGNPAECNYALAWSTKSDIPIDKKLWFDLNADGQIDNQDIAIAMQNILEFAQKSSNYLAGDINKDGFIDYNDLRILMDELKVKTENIQANIIE